MIGTDNYILARIEIKNNDSSGAKEKKFNFLILQHYVYLFFIPVFPIFVSYAIEVEGSPHLFKIEEETLKKDLSKTKIPFTKRLEAFSFPIAAIILVVCFQTCATMRDNILADEHKKNILQKEREENERVKRKEAFLSDTTALLPYANHLIDITKCIDKSEVHKPTKIKKTTREYADMAMYKYMYFSHKRDTNLLYNMDNTMPCVSFRNIFEESNEEQNNKGNAISRYFDDYFNNNKLNDNGLLQWYYSRFQFQLSKTDGTVEDVENINKYLKKYEYVAVAYINSYVKPHVSEEDEKKFYPGYVLADVFVYNIKTQKLIEKYDMITGNSHLILKNSLQMNIDMDDKLLSDLKENYQMFLDCSK